MTDNVSEPRSRRALLAAAAGGAAALAASAALPLTAMANTGDNVVLGTDPNDATSTTSINVTGTGVGLKGSSSGGAGIVGWSISAPTDLDTEALAFTGIYGWSATGTIDDPAAIGVVGQSDEYGVLGNGAVGVYGFGAYGVIGESQSASGAGVLALGLSSTDLALQVVGKVKFSRSGRSNISAGASSKLITLAGVTSGSKVFALLHSNRSGRYVRAVVPATGKFRIYLNSSVSSTTSVAWFVLD